MGFLRRDRRLGKATAVALAICFSLSGVSVNAGEHSEPRDPSPVTVDPSTPQAWASGRAAYIADLTREALKWGLPPEIADAVAHVESGYNPNLVGTVGEVGLMQVGPPTAAMMGFKGTPAELAAPATNIGSGVRYLAGAWRLAGGDLCRALTKYRAGHGEEWMSPLSQVYCQRARSYLVEIGSPLAAQIAPATVHGAAGLLAPKAAGGTAPVNRLSRATSRFAALPRLVPWYRPGGHIRTERDSQSFWAMHDARVRAICSRIEAGWRRRSGSGSVARARG
jgi:hypothetical protein